MARKSKKQANRAPRSQPTKDELLSRMGIKKKKVNEELATMGDDIAPISSNLVAVEFDEEQGAKAEAALEEIQELTEQLKKKISEHETSTENYQTLSVGIEEQQQKLDSEIDGLSRQKMELQQRTNDLEEGQKLFEEQKSSLLAKQEQLNKQAKQQLLQQDKLAELKAEAEAGFVREHQIALQKKREELIALQRTHDQSAALKNSQLNDLEADILGRESNLAAREANAKAGFIAEQKEVLKDFALKKQQAESELVTLNDRVFQFQEKLTLNQNKQKVRERSEQEWKDNVKVNLESQYRTELDSLEAQLNQERKNREQDRLSIKELQKELINFKDLQLSLESANIEDIKEELNNLRQQNKELKTKLWTSDENLEEKCELLDDLVIDQKQEIFELKQDLHNAEKKIHSFTMSVAEKFNLAKDVNYLSRDKQRLEKMIDEYQDKFDALVDKQQSRETFPALAEMDRNFKRKATNLQPISTLKNFANQLRWGMASLPNAPLYYCEEDIRAFLAGLAMSNLHILQGMSGTGKTSLAKAFAKVVGGHCTDIAVQAGWRDKDDLLGHYNAFEKRFYESEALQALYRAQLPAYDDRINIILLDEMNLSRPEQYFAEFNSALEKDPHDKDRSIVLLEKGQEDAPKQFLHKRKIFVPENVWFIGTANHDETTNEFADKTYDRAHVMELTKNDGKFSTVNYDSGLEYSFSSLMKSFDDACQKHKETVEKILAVLNKSVLKKVLEDDFTVSWSNRFEHHALRFIPVMTEAGGSIEEGVDHLLATKLFRAGKATGRFDINVTDLDKVSEALTDTWKALKLRGEPSRTLSCIDKDRRRMERGV